MKPPPLQRWTVFFGPGHARAPWWLRAITHRDWRHCFAVAFDPLREEWVLFWPSWARLEIRLVPQAWIEHWLLHAQAGHLRALKVEAGEGGTLPPVVLGCAGAIGWLLGLTGWQLRPQALHRHLLSRGAQEVMPVRVPEKPAD